MYKLPPRKNIAPLFKIVADLEKPSEKSQMINDDANCRTRTKRKSKKSTRNSFLPRSKSAEGILSDDKDNENAKFKEILEAKDSQISKMIEKITQLFECNNHFAIEHKKLQKDYQKLVEKIGELEIESKRSCDTCTAYENERDSYFTENKELINDVKMMKILVYRLNVQLERYQDVIRTTNRSDNDVFKLDFNHSHGNKENLNWGDVQTHTLGPLLNAYEETVAEKNDLVQQYEKAFCDFTGKLKKVVDENENLQNELDGIKTSQSSWFSEKTRLQAQVDIFRNKAEIQAKRADLAKEKLMEVLKCYEQKVQAQCLDIERLQEAYSRSKGELASLRNLNQKPEVVVESLKECQRLFEELKIQHDSEKVKLVENVDALKADLASKSNDFMKSKEENREQQSIYERQKEINEILMEKNEALKQNMNRIRQSKNQLKTRLKNVMAWGKGIDMKKEHLKSSWCDFKLLQEKIQQKDVQIQAMQIRFSAEVDQLKRKLKQREDSLRKILEDKANMRQFSTNL